MDYAARLYESLPVNAKKYYKEKSSVPLQDIVYKPTFLENIGLRFGLLRIHPLCTIRYANSNELLPVLRNGKHQLCQGPGYFWVNNFNDKVFPRTRIGEDINFGPIKLVYVRPGGIKFAVNVSTSHPMLLGPGMHYFDDVNVSIDPDEIILDSQGENKVVKVGSDGVFSFIFVNTGSQAIINSRNGELLILDSGLHFIEAPDTLRTFASIQQEHFKFGSCDPTAPIFLTADNVELHVDATIFYRISDVKKVFTTSIKDKKDLLETLHSQAMSTLMTIIRSETFSNIGKKTMTTRMEESVRYENEAFSSSSQISSSSFLSSSAYTAPIVTVPPLVKAEALSGDANVGGSATLAEVSNGFQSIIHDCEPQFKSTMQRNFGDRLGFEIQSLRIEKIEFADKAIQKQVSELAMTFTKLSAQEATIAAQKKVQLAEAERDAASQLIQTKAEANRSIIKANAVNEAARNKVRVDNEILREVTEAKMSALKLETETAANNRVASSMAEAKSIRLIGEAEIDILRQKNDLPFAQLRIVADAQKEVLKGVNKVIYTTEQSLLMQPYMGLVENNMGAAAPGPVIVGGAATGTGTAVRK